MNPRMPPANDQATKELPSLEEVRRRIDGIDDRILALLHERLQMARTVGQIKTKTKKAKWDPLRERAIYERLFQKNQGIFPEESLTGIYHEIITACRLIQKKLTVAYLGPEATFTHLAGVRHFGHSAAFLPMETIEEVFDAVQRQRVNYGVVPVENSIEGAIFSTLDSFMRHNVKISGEVRLEVVHNLANLSGDINDIKKVVSHAQPLAQCREWLHKNLPAVPTLAVASTGVAARMASEDASLAAIASELAVRTYRLQVVEKGIHDYAGNTTRFLVLGDKIPPPSGHDRTSLLLGLVDRPGALNEVLAVLSAHGINLSKIESRPIKGKQWKYLFFLDMSGHAAEAPLTVAFDRLRELCSFFELLGSYPETDPSAPNA